MKQKCDVLVVGAGMAGLVAGLKLAKDGLDVVLVEKNKQFGVHNNTKLDITESSDLDPIISELKLPVLDRSNTSKWFSPKNHFLFESKVHDLFLKRGAEKDSFDSVVGKNVQKKGVNVLFDSQLQNLNFVHGSVVSATIKHKNKKKEFFPKFVVGADGSYGKTAQLAGLDSFVGKETQIAGFGIAGTNFDLAPSLTHIFFDHRLLPGGYFYIAQSKKVLGFAMAVFNKARTQGNLSAYYKKFVSSNPIVKNLLLDHTPFNFSAGACRVAMLKRRVKGNLCLVGDSARVMDPIFGYGARQAIFSGFHAADTIARNFSHHHFVLPNYHDLLGKTLLSAEREAHFLRSLFDRLTNRDFDFLVEAASFLHEHKNLDEVLEKPPKHVALLIHSFLRRPHQSVPLSIKFLIHRMFYF
ncbi:NAD(P)/FAD-dependent oxidoreductase [Candidatus Micrarchaeota archaeon]|nr:NAD(P)/FAD-dependent oxidoreductase [Candidatus Micrarchaeota archaeon]MBU1930316.1 NAD(P)/FAD-dependent oxidoreductase [Candidatus Micrarchaeota archaeon]